MATLKKYPKTMVVVLCPAKQVDLAGVESKLDITGKVFWAKRVADSVSSGSIATYAIPDSKVEVMTSSEVAAVKYTGDKGVATWLKVTLPGGGEFSSLEKATINIYCGSAVDAPDTIALTAPFKIERISTGSEELVI